MEEGNILDDAFKYLTTYAKRMYTYKNFMVLKAGGILNTFVLSLCTSENYKFSISFIKRMSCIVNRSIKLNYIQSNYILNQNPLSCSLSLM